MANISQIKLPSGETYGVRAPVIPYGEVDSTSTSTAYTATVSGISELVDGTIVMLKNGVVTSASGFTINVNGLGAKPVYNSMATGHDTTAPTRDTTIFNISYTMLFVYSTDLVSGGCWICYRGYDGNTNTIGYQLRTNSGNLVASDTGHKYRLWLTSADGKKWVPINTSTSDNATTSRTLNTRSIDPFGAIVYNSTNGTVSSGTRPAATTLWQQYTLTIGYSYVKTLTAWNPVFLKCSPNTDGSAVMKDIVQSLPSSNDGFIYIFLGTAYSATAIELNVNHPVYYYDGTGIRLWTGKAIPTKTSELTNDGDGTSAFATMADIGDLGGGTITGVKTTAGAHTTIDVSSGNASFNVPTKTSHLTNDSGFITSYTDTKNTAGSTNSTSKLYLIGATSQAANPQTYSNSYLYYSSGLKSTVSSGNGAASCDINQTATSITLKYDGTSSGNKLTIKNNKIEISGNVYLSNYGDSYSTNILSSATSSNKTITFPNATGTVALTSDIPTVPTKTSDLTNDSGFVTTDEKLSTTLASDGWHCLLLGTASSTASTKYYSTGLKCSISSTSVWLSLGTNSSDGPEGELTLYGKGKKGVDISVPNNLTKNVAVKLPSAEGTLALIEDIPTVPTNVSDLVNDSGYITGISSSDVTTALGYTPYNSTNPNGYTSNTGTITGITMNGSSKGTSGVVNLGTVVTDVFLDGTSVVSSGIAELTSATLTASDDGNGNVTLGLIGIGTLSTASGVSF